MGSVGTGGPDGGFTVDSQYEMDVSRAQATAHHLMDVSTAQGDTSLETFCLSTGLNGERFCLLHMFERGICSAFYKRCERGIVPPFTQV